MTSLYFGYIHVHDIKCCVNYDSILPVLQGSLLRKDFDVVHRRAIYNWKNKCMHTLIVRIQVKMPVYVFFPHEILKFQFFLPHSTEFTLSFKNNN